MALLITFLLGGFFLLGMLAVKYAPDHELVEHASYAAAFGALIAIMVLDLLPEILEVFEPAAYPRAGILVLAGIGLLKLLDIFIPEHDEADEENPVHIGVMATVAIVIHNIIEGMTVCSVCMTDLSGGMALALGVGIHNIPMGMLIYSALHPEEKGKRYLLMFLASVSTFAGGLVMMGMSAVSHELLESVLMCLALGMIIFITFFELMPLLLRGKMRKENLLGVAGGFLAVLISTVLG